MSRLPKACLFGLLIAFLGATVSFSHFSHVLEENWGLGLLFALRGARQPPAEVVVVSIDSDSAEHLNIPANPNAWPRSLHARLVETLTRLGAEVVTFDVYFTEPRPNGEDGLFAEHIKNARNVVLAEPLRARDISAADGAASRTGEHRLVKMVKPIVSLSQAAVATAPFVLPRRPARVNEYWTFQTDAGDAPTFPVVAFQLYALRVYDDFIGLLEKITPAEAAKLPRDADRAIETIGAVRLIRAIREIFESDPAIVTKMARELEASGLRAGDERKYRLLKSLVNLYSGGNRRYLNYYGPPRSLHTIPFYKALTVAEDAGAGKPLDLKGKAVFVGLSETLFTEGEDSYYTVFSPGDGPLLSGVEIAATAFANLWEETPVRPIGSAFYIFIILAWGFLIGMVCRLAPTLLAALATAGLSALYLIAAAHQFNADGVWHPIVIPLLVQSPAGFFGSVLWNYFETNKERQNIRKALAYYVPDDVVDELARNVVDIKQSGQMVYGVCLFGDVAGYTTLSERMDPQQLNELMHRYFEAVFEPVKRHGGLVVNLKGDSFLAIWKSGRPDASLRHRACLAALDVAKEVHRFSRSVGELAFPTRVGVHAGQIFLGNIGAGAHYEYGPTGDTVNTASRLEGLNKHLGTEVLVSEEVVQQLEGVVTREVGRFVLKGKVQPVVVHQLISRTEESAAPQQAGSELFLQGLLAFRRRAWDEAMEKFHRATDSSEEPGPARFYLKLCERYKKNPPDEPWDGIIPLEEK